MDRLKELIEARDAANELIIKIDNAKSSLDSALSWGKWDMFGGEFITSWLKRNKIKQANQDILQINESLENLKNELEDINMTLPSGVSDTVSDRAWDLWFDNIFTDIRVQGEIKDSIRQLETSRSSVQELIRKLDAEIQGL